MRLVIYVMAATLVLDQVSKFFVVHMLDLWSRNEITVIPGWFNLRMAWNERSTTAPDEPGPDGFGSTLLKRVIQNHFGGTFSRRFDPTGLQCEIELALEPIDISRRIEA